MATRKSLSPKTVVPAVLIALIASIAGAMASQDIVVKVPFEFQAGATHFAPGQYVLTMDNVSTGSVMIRTADRSRSAILLTHKSSFASVQSAPVISFRTVGESRFLSAVQGESATQRWEIVPSANEASLARKSEQPVVASLMAEASGTK